MITAMEIRFFQFFSDDQSETFRLASDQARNRSHFDLAVLLMHELSHAMWQRRDRDRLGEVLYDCHEPGIELGFACER
jgi:hypothetical protein